MLTPLQGFRLILEFSWVIACSVQLVWCATTATTELDVVLLLLAIVAGLLVLAIEAVCLLGGILSDVSRSFQGL